MTLGERVKGWRICRGRLVEYLLTQLAHMFEREHDERIVEDGGGYAAATFVSLSLSRFPTRTRIHRPGRHLASEVESFPAISALGPWQETDRLEELTGGVETRPTKPGKQFLYAVCGERQSCVSCRSNDMPRDRFSSS
jgi:hypothetical protein